jgi:hypothetical protein
MKFRTMARSLALAAATVVLVGSAQGAASASDGGDGTGYLWHFKLSGKERTLVLHGQDANNYDKLVVTTFRKNSANIYFESNHVAKVAVYINGLYVGRWSNDMNHCFDESRTTTKQLTLILVGTGGDCNAK